MTRRRFFWVAGTGIAGSAALVGAAAWWRGHAGEPTFGAGPAPALRVFSPGEHAVLAAVVATLTGSADDVAGTAAVYLDGVLATGAEADLEDARALLWLVEHGTLVLLAGAPRFTRLAEDRRAAYLGGWGTSRLGMLRTGFRALKQLAALGVWRSPEQWPAIGYAGPIVPPGWDVEAHGGG